MKLVNLELTNFRNYQNLKLDFHPNLNIFLGQNAQGKTNILESIYFLALTRSHRTSTDKDLIGWSDKNMEVAGLIQKKVTKTPLQINMTKQGRTVKINHLKQPRLADYIGQMNVIMFAPEDLEIIKGSPSIRRRFIDMEIGQIKPIYLYDTIRYNKILKERNAYLKFDRKQIDTTYLAVLDDQLIEYGSKIIKQRIDFVKKLESISQDLHFKLSHELENLTISYKSNIQLDSLENIQLADIETEFRNQLSQIQDKEILRHQSLIGPHKDDLAFFVNNINVGDFGSQGQQRTTALSVRLAEIDLIYEETGEYPILLLDDVMSELDNTRQLDLLDTIKDKAQTFITTTSLNHLQNLPENLQIFQVANGKIEQEKRDSL